MARISIFALVAASLATLTAAMGPNYLPDHDVEQSRLAKRFDASSSQHDEAIRRHIISRRSAHGSRRAKRSCRAGSGSSSGGGSGSGGSSGGSTGTTTSSAASSTKTGTVGGSSNTNSTIGGGGSSSSALQSLIDSTGISQFLSSNTGIGSWFRTNAGSDSTNGMSWCQTRYQDDWMGFAPDVEAMLNNFGGDYTKAATAYCGLEAIVTTPEGVSKTMYIVDGFAHQWVRTPGSIDITKGSFAALFGRSTDNKNDVIKGITWKLTGNRKAEYGFKAGK